MPQDVLYGKTLRKSFARTQEIREMPNLLEIQKSSYKWFLETGLREVFKDVDSVTDYSGNLELSFIDYSMNEKPKYDEIQFIKYGNQDAVERALTLGEIDFVREVSAAGFKRLGEQPTRPVHPPP